jgi:hypothetical protein
MFAGGIFSRKRTEEGCLASIAQSRLDVDEKNFDPSYHPAAKQKLHVMKIEMIQPYW